MTAPNFVGWNSSYTAEPIPEPQMQEWLATTIARIGAFKPNRVLEIGCGVGLLLQYLAPRCVTYVGTDFSAAALGQLQQWIGTQDALKHVQLMHRSATELDDLEPHSFDTVILNSVVQYFPDIDYLITVLQRSVRLLSEGGRIFIGDVRHLGSLATFHSAVQLTKAAANVRIGELRKRIAQAISQDKELVIDPQLFRALPGNLPGISAAEVHVKRGSSENELTRYRYDVTLQVGSQLAARMVCEPLDWQEAGGSVAALETALKERRWSATHLLAIPNARLAREVAGQKLIETADEHLEASALRRQLNESSYDAVAPEMIWKLVETHGYDVTVSPADPGRFDVRLLDRTRAAEVPHAIPAVVPAKPWTAYANDPLENGFRQQLIPQLRAYLQGRLPEYMIPAAWMVLKQLPLTHNGKVDRRALPPPQGRSADIGEYRQPKNELEQTLASIWAEVLRVDRVGVDDNFFELGGHSLLAIKALSRINQVFGSALRVIDLYRSPTVGKLAVRLVGTTVADERVDLINEAMLDEDIAPSAAVRLRPTGSLLMTGATGFVGRFLLAQLLQEADAKIYCLVRDRSVEAAALRLRTTLSKWGLWRDEFERRLIPVPADLSRPRLGLDPNSYRLLCEQPDRIYHCATSMNHLETYQMARATNVDGSQELLRIAALGRLKCINYVSTLGVFTSPGTEGTRTVSESTPIDHEPHYMSRGYVASKWVGEKLFMMASERGIPCNIFRLGLVWADTEHGRYDELQRGYRIFKSCLLSGYGIQNFRYELPPTPVDYVARAIAHLADRHAEGRGIFHLSSARQAIENVFERCNEIAGTSLELVPFYRWICEIKRLHREKRTLPAVPLVEFAFTMDEASFTEFQRGLHLGRSIHFDAAATQRELERAGIVAPELNDDLLRVFVKGLLLGDADLQHLVPAMNQ